MRRAFCEVLWDEYCRGEQKREGGWATIKGAVRTALA